MNSPFLLNSLKSLFLRQGLRSLAESPSTCSLIPAGCCRENALAGENVRWQLVDVAVDLVPARSQAKSAFPA
jgi:hypothetical protein